MVESRAQGPDGGLVPLTDDEVLKPVEKNSRPRKRLDARYKFYRLDTIEKRIDYLNNQLGFTCTVGEYGEKLTPEQELSILEASWADKHR